MVRSKRLQRDSLSTTEERSSQIRTYRGGNSESKHGDIKRGAKNNGKKGKKKGRYFIKEIKSPQGWVGFVRSPSGGGEKERRHMEGGRDGKGKGGKGEAS